MVACAGRLYCDLVFTGAPRLPELGTEVFCEGLTLAAGGGAFITAAWLRALDRPSALVAVAPAEPFGRSCRDAIREAGIVDLCVPAPAGADPQVTVAIPHGGDRAFLTRRPGAALPTTPLANLLNGMRHLHVGELATLAEHPGLIAEARALGLTVSADCAWDDVAPAGAAALIDALDLFLPNEREMEKLGADGVRPDPSRTVVKRGAAGATSHGGAHRALAPTTQVVDATGAGDAFDAGYLDAWLAGADPETCLRAGVRCGTAAVRGTGGTGGLHCLGRHALPKLAESVA